ncbi:TetR/AcrR family transcriptional regulator [Paraburkholderia humisilvae]|uniref:HTH-type transcriptional repressor ComR n=1 Tax=Paraburkholderia humisilvae TaxID=627669 RepID=A0A6J5E6R9_9BURK|nr:TetR/AcrR family transcriptional regulator [Paraburkholderia humisilvae]CAB3762199.1 HTH-type transcriptional repressor ComR [Paraburkholderia humisilvae]
MAGIEQRREPRPRGRPREFDRRAALRSAMETFWLRGFDACSISELGDAMGINPPSLYAAFGSKEALFREAVELYVDAEGGAAMRQLHAHESVRDGLRAMFRTSAELFTGKRPAKGCMIFLGGMSVSAEHEDLRAYLRSLRRKASTAIAERFTQAKMGGELAADADPKALASLCITVFAGLSVEAADGVRRAVLFDAIDQFIDGLPWRKRA